MLEPVLRFDRATGRAWIAEITQSSTWREIGADAPAEVPATEEDPAASSDQAAAQALLGVTS